MEPDPEKAFREARQSGKQVLLVFSGSDWCIPCIRLEKNILTDSAFRNFAGERFIILEADFPQKKKVAPSLKSQYEELADQFNAEGSFPKILLLTAERTKLAVLSYHGQSPADFIQQMKDSLKP